MYFCLWLWECQYSVGFQYQRSKQFRPLSGSPIITYTGRLRLKCRGTFFQASGQVMGSCSGILKGKHSLAEVYKRVGKSVCNAVFASKTGNKKRVTCSATWLQNWLNSDVARFTTGIRTCLLANKVARCFFVDGTNAQHRYSTRFAKQFVCFLLPVSPY